MKTLKILGGAIAGIVSLALATALVWGLLYLCIQPVKDWTNEHIFKTEEAKEDDEENENVVEVNNVASIDFSNKILKVEI